MNFGRKGKLMLAIFMISGMLVAFATINMYSILTKDYKDALTMDERYIQVNKNSFIKVHQLYLKVNMKPMGIIIYGKTRSNQLIDLGNGAFKSLAI